MTNPLDLETIEGLVDIGSFARGQEYEAQGRVQSFKWARQDTVMEGYVSGKGGQTYRVSVMFSDSDGDVHPTVGVCSCPVHVNCKHVVAVLLAYRRDQLQGAAFGNAPAWEQVLSGLVPRRSRPDKSLALELQLKPTADRGRLALLARPLVMGSKGRWVRGQANWNSLAYAQTFADADPDQHRVLTTLHALNGAMRHAFDQDSWLRLDTLPLRTLWALLREGVDKGLSLVHDDDVRSPVRMESGEANFVVDVSDGSDGMTLRPGVRIGDAVLPLDRIGLLGDPSQAVALWRDGLHEGHRDVDDTSFSLALMARPVPRELRALTTRSEDLVVPTGDTNRFLDEFFPLLRSRVDTVSSDNTFAAPSTPRPALALHVKVLPEHRLEIDWEWLYRRVEDPPGVGNRRPLNGEDDPAAGRDPESEADLIEVLELQRFPFLLENSRYGLRLAPRAQIDGTDTVEFVSVLLPELTEHPDVLINIDGQRITYRQAEAAPTIEIATKDIEDSRDWFGLEVSVKIEGEEVPFHELFRSLATEEETMILPSGTYFSLDRPELQQLLKLIQEAGDLSDARDEDGLVRINRYQADLWDELADLGIITAQAEAWDAAVSSLRAGAEVVELPTPEGLKATLRDYQRDGYHWLAFLQAHDLGGVLADDMGLGKTVQALAMICHARERSAASGADGPASPPFLVVAPTSVVSNWAHESARFAPGLDVRTITETSGRGKYDLGLATQGADIVITSYALFRIDFDAYGALDWAGLILDEAQFVKNHQSKAYQCVRRLETPFKLAITGTPLENNLMELWSLFSITAPGLFGTPGQFGDLYRRPIEKDGNAELLAQLRRRIRPLMLRRSKEQVATELPAKQEQVMELDLLPRHRRIYQTHLQHERKKVLGLLEDMDENRFAIFRSLTALRLLSLDAGLYDAEKYSDVPSTKLEALGELLEDIIAEGHRTLIFSQFTGFLGKVRDQLTQQGIDFAYLDGSTRKRAEVIDRFRSGEAPVFLISLKAGGFGLNLTEADYCILLDPWWNPAAENQAVDRTHRIGQTKNVHVYRLVANDTIEQKVMELKAGKVKLFEGVMGDAAVTGSGLSASDIRGLLG